MTNPFAMPETVAAQSTPVPAQQAAPAAPVAPAAASYGDDPFGAPAPRAERPRVRDIHGRLLLIVPEKVERVPNKNKDAKPGEMQNRMTADVIVLDGGPLNYGGTPEKLNGAPHNKVAQLPMRIEGLYISAVGVVSQCRVALHNRLTGTPGVTMVVGRLLAGEAKDEKSSPPYYISEPTDDEKALARAYLAANPIKPADPFA